MFFYSIKTSKNIRANKYTFAKPEKERENGIINYGVTLPVAKGREIKTYVVIEDVTEEYIKGMELEKLLSKNELVEVGIEPFKRTIIEIPIMLKIGLLVIEVFISSWNYMGQYRLYNDQIALYYGVNLVSPKYIDGRFKRYYL